ncbi:glucose-6-phosphate 1-dehydrogenase [Steroidobacter denitrificans]|uniref:Glucose-6-phosphate 1-dehydrogenase n=1 Tax=Steroidobacter denitrificans TaxID=465721 RepID=A0A127F5G6_STEDE|nr:glucose-6-phosphate dehydrogenase [Steroidobacter denitrificans]AMN45684.1 glucose-6-phosphate 1-dehydrogenase [Steroidobacter denitrificans]
MQTLPTFDLVLFGGTGDLAMRKLLPALYRRTCAGQVCADTRIIGAARSDLSREQYLAQVKSNCEAHLDGEFNERMWESFARCVDYCKVDAGEDLDYAALSRLLEGREDHVRIFFMSTAPNLFALICEGLARHSLVTSASRVVLEKPLGEDLVSSRQINERVGTAFREPQIFRIDHYLGKETVQNLLALRFGNMLFEPLWRRGRVRHVQITLAEDVGVERRAQFYDQTGALRDMVQNHLLQLLCIIAMEPPATANPDAMRDEKLKVLHALRPLAGNDARNNTVRGQYKAGAIAGQPVIGYLDEKDVPPNSVTETFVALKVEIDSWRWAGVPFYLRTGKRLQEKQSEIVVTFEDVPHALYERPEQLHSLNRLVIQLQPEEGITLNVLAKSPGEGMRLRPAELSLDFAEYFNGQRLDGYERLLTDIINGNLTLFMRRDELDAAWAWIDPIREAWQQYEERPKAYIAGTWGPAAASSLIVRDGFVWRNEL